MNDLQTQTLGKPKAGEAKWSQCKYELNEQLIQQIDLVMPSLHCLHKTGWMIYLMLTVICAIFFSLSLFFSHLLCLVNIRALAVGRFADDDALAKSAKNAICWDCPLMEERSNIMLRQWEEKKPVNMHHVHHCIQRLRGKQNTYF